MKEERFLERLKRWRLYKDPYLGLGIGDDAALYGDFLLTKDLLVEGVHFSLELMTPYEVGRRAVLVNVSDIAAMGGYPLSMLFGISFSGDEGIFREISEGARRVCEEWGINLIGGDMVGSPGPIFISITLLGKASRPLMREGARPGDLIFVTGTLGDGSMGLEVLKKGLGEEFPYLSLRYKNPIPRVREASIISSLDLASSLMDLSDGLSIDIRRLLGDLGAEICLKNLPLSDEYKKAASRLLPQEDLYEYALYGGDDYELLFTAAPEKLDMVKKLPFRVSLIGKVVEKGFFLVDDARRPFDERGYRHF